MRRERSCARQGLGCPGPGGWQDSLLPASQSLQPRSTSGSHSGHPHWLQGSPKLDACLCNGGMVLFNHSQLTSQRGVCRAPSAPAITHGQDGGRKPRDTVRTRKEGDVRSVKIAFCPDQSSNSLEQLARQAHEVASRMEQGNSGAGCIPVEQGPCKATQRCQWNFLYFKYIFSWLQPPGASDPQIPLHTTETRTGWHRRSSRVEHTQIHI